MSSRRSFLSLLLLSPLPVHAAEAVTSSIPLTELAGSSLWPAPLRNLISYALSLTTRSLTYQFGSADPDKGGMDCSGTVHHLLTRSGFRKVPRQSDALFDWVRTAGILTVVTGTPSLTDPGLARLKPGDLLFWSGTYDTGARTSPVSHVMIYLGKTTKGKPVMFGASDGRPYQGKRQNGVSVFDFRLPAAASKSRFVGYGPIPGMDVRKVSEVPPG